MNVAPEDTILAVDLKIYANNIFTARSHSGQRLRVVIVQPVGPKTGHIRQREQVQQGPHLLEHGLLRRRQLRGVNLVICNSRSRDDDRLPIAVNRLREIPGALRAVGV